MNRRQADGVRAGRKAPGWCAAARLVAALLGVLACLPGWSEEAKMDPRVAYAPDVVGVERFFMVALKVPQAAPDVAVECPEGVKLLDRTRLPAKEDVRRFYFRASQPAKRAEIRFAHPDGPLVVPVEVWGFEDLRAFRELKGVQLPRRWPLGKPLPELKTRQTVTTEAQKAALKGGAGPTSWLEAPDDAIWNLQPDSTFPRWHWVNIQYGCPVHGPEIYKKGAYYPWLKDRAFPYKWKIVCPVGGESYPSNDTGAGDFTGGDFPDDGIGGGYVAKDRKHYGFIAEISQAYCHVMLGVAPACAQGYLATGDVCYVHKTLVALSRLAVEHAYLAMMTQHRHRNTVAQVERFGQGRFDEGPFLAHAGLTVYPIDQPSYQWSHAEAYDAIFTAIEKDPEIIPFLQRKGFDVKTHEDVRRFIEENLMAVWMQAAMDGATHSNEPYHQRGLARMAEALDYQGGTDFMDWLYDGLGRMRIFVPNTYFRDGAPYESTGGYNGMHVVSLGPIIDSIEHMRALRPEVYPEGRYPALSKSRRYRNVFDFAMDTVTIDRSFPNIGDTGGHPVYSKLGRIPYQNGDTASFEHAYRLFRDPKFAWALVNSPGWKPSVDFPFTRKQIEREAAKWPDTWNDRSSLHDGYGIAILRGGRGDRKRALWMMYGRNRSHSQDDIMDIGLQAHEGVLLSHMGYPRNWGYWEPSWTSHHLARAFPYQTLTAQPQLFADAGPVHVAEARAQDCVDRVDGGQGLELPPDNWQRRLLALVDVDDDRFYCVDFYRFSGGTEQWWAFHGQEGEFTTEGIPLARQEGGTLAGADVAYGDAEWLKANGCRYGTYGWSGPRFAFPHLYNVAKGASEGVWSADWKLKTGDGLHLKLTVASAEGAEVNVCDGKSPAGGSPYEMKWIMMRRSGEAPLRTQVLSLLETHRGTPLIRKVERLALSGADEAGLPAAGCVVHLDDRVDTVLASADSAVARTASGGVRFAGRFGLYSERDGVPVQMTLVGGTSLGKGKYGIRLEKAEYRARITRVDRATETISVSPAPHAPAAMKGAVIFIAGPARRTAYKVLDARKVPGGAELKLALDSRIGTGKVTGTADLAVQTDTSFPLHHFRYYHGAHAVNAARSAEYRILEARDSKAVFIDPAYAEAKAEKLAAEFPKDSWFDIYDYGNGDDVIWPYAVSVTRTAEGVYRVVSPVPVTLDLPDGGAARSTRK